MGQLSERILHGTLEEVKSLLMNGAEVNEHDQYGCTPLICAVIAQKPDMLKALLPFRPWIDEEDYRGCTALFWAVDNQNLALTNLLLEAGANPNKYTPSSQPIIAYPIIRRDRAILRALVDKGADIDFGRDFVNTKLAAHRFELEHQGYIVNTKPAFIAMSYEGFFLEFTLDVIRESLFQFINHAYAQNLSAHFSHAKIIIRALADATILRKIREQGKDHKLYDKEISEILDKEILVIPVSYEGHAITFVKYGHFLAQCDRGAQSKISGSVCIYNVTRPENLNQKLLKRILFERNTGSFINMKLMLELGLEFIEEIPTESQVTGNCSWANVEACVATLMCMLQMQNKTKKTERIAARESALTFHAAWKEWDKDRTLNKSVRSFKTASKPRRAAIATLLGAIFYQRLYASSKLDVKRALYISKVLFHEDYQFVLGSYAKTYCAAASKDERAKNFIKLLKKCGSSLPVVLKW